MKQILYTVIFIVLIDLSFQNCANPGRPTGGPKDTIPPTLTYSYPTNGTTNFQENTIELEFSEYINADKIKQQLIITPATDINYKSIVKRNKLIIRLDGELEDSTTYNFNFANGVTDITEKNPAVNLSIAISTGPSIDSMSIQGSVEDLLTQESSKGYVVGLYPISDSLDLLATKPMYFATTNDSGNYKIQYIKSDHYRVIAFEDDNGNYILDPETESHGFLADTIHLDSATNLTSIRCLVQNVKPLSLINARPVGRYVEVKFNKSVDTYTLAPFTSSNIVGENKDIIRLYKPLSVNYNDSVTTYITAEDSLGNSITDTLKYVFIESNRKPSAFNYSFNQNSLVLTDTPKISLQFSKPILTFDTSKLLVKADTLLSYKPNYIYEWNSNSTQLDLSINVNQSLIDSLLSTLPKPDTTIADTAQSIQLKKPNNQSPQFSLFAETGAFISVEEDSSKVKSVTIKSSASKATGVLKVSLTTDKTNYWFQLLDTNQKVAYQTANSKRFTLSSVKPGTYSIRILIDDNKDGKWSYGNLIQNKEPEEVFIYDGSTSIRENWVIELDISF